MRFLPVATCLLGVSCASLLSASLLPILHLDPKTLQTYQDYVAKFDQETAIPYYESGRMWMDARGCCANGSTQPAATPLVEPRHNAEIPGGSIHHFSGVLHIPGATIEDVRHIMVDYSNYPKYYKGDLARANGTPQPDSTPADEHFRAELTLTQTTIWMSVAFNTSYDTHYRRLSPDRWASHSATITSQEWRDPKNEAAGLYPDGEDHGLLWRANTYWFVRASGDGIDIEADSISLSRPVPTGFGWWGVKRSKEAVGKMLTDMRAAIALLHRAS